MTDSEAKALSIAAPSSGVLKMLLLIATSTIVLTGCSPTESGSEAAPCFQCLPWNHPDRIHRFEEISRHVYTDGAFVSADGRWVAATLPGEPVNRLSLYDLENERTVELVHEQRLIKLEHPTISPDGSMMAVVATPPTYYGVGRILVMDFGRFELIRTIGEDCRSYIHPVFSNSGEYLYYARDVGMESNCVGAEYRRSNIYSIFRYDLRTGEEVRVINQQFLSIYGIYELNDDLYVVASREFELRDDGVAGLCYQLDTRGQPCDVIQIYRTGYGRLLETMNPNIDEFIGDSQRVRLLGVTTNDRISFYASPGVFNGEEMPVVLFCSENFDDCGGFSYRGSTQSTHINKNGLYLYGYGQVQDELNPNLSDTFFSLFEVCVDTDCEARFRGVDLTEFNEEGQLVIGGLQ